MSYKKRTPIANHVNGRFLSYNGKYKIEFAPL